MKRIYSLLIAGALAFAVSGAAGCVTSDPVDDGVLTCDNFDYYLYYCPDYVDEECGMHSSCVSDYWSLYLDEQILLDDCADCLAVQVDSGICSYCIDLDGFDCHDTMADLLGYWCQ